MKILWVRHELLHPVQSGGQIVSYEIARRLHQRHEIHFVAYEREFNSAARSRASEYCSRLYPVSPPEPYRQLRPYVLELARALLSPLPFDARIAKTGQMQQTIRERLAAERFDVLFCEWLSMTPNLPDLEKWVILNHNVESVLVARRIATEPKFLVRRYHALDARQTAGLERKVCRSGAHVLAISELDRDLIQRLYGTERVTPIHIGVSAEQFFRPGPESQLPHADLVLVGNMGWLPNVDGALWFAQEILPLIRRERPDCTLALVGQRPAEEISALAQHDPRITVTGTVEDVRPWLWGGTVSIVPIRHGGGVRIKIYEAMAAGIPVVSTTIGAEGLDVRPDEHLLIADNAADFAEACIRLLASSEERARIAGEARRIVEEKHTWDRTANEVERVFEASRRC